VRSNSRYQYLFLNGRNIKDRGLFAAMADAYRGLIMPKDYPVAFLTLQVDPALVDVNVHPTKTEVRFRDKDHVFSLVRNSVRRALMDHGAPTSLKMKSDPQDSRESRSDFKSKGYDVLKGLEAELFDGREDSSASRHTTETRPSFGATPLAEDEGPVASLCGQKGRGPRAESLAGRAPRFMQIHRSYLIVESDEGLRILDQHALHERKLYEELLVRFERSQGEDQPLLIPEILDLGATDQALLLDHATELAAMGIVIEPFGGKSVAVRSMPALLRKMSAPDLVEQILKVLGRDASKLDRIEFLRETAAGLACRAAVKFNDALEDSEIRALLTWHENHPDFRNCPHGRPVAIQVTLKELELQFQRKK
jgi:DNA mismatch repair protein MutL